MATDRHSRQAGILEYQRKTLPLSTDIRDVPTQSLLAVRYWNDDTLSLIPPEQQVIANQSMIVGGATRGWLLGDPGDPYPPRHYFRADTVIVKRADSASPSGFSYKVNTQKEWWSRNYSTLFRTGTVFPDLVDSSRMWVAEELFLAFDKVEIWKPPQNAYVDNLLLAAALAAPEFFNTANRATIGNPTIHAYTMYSVPADATHFPNGTSEPPVRPLQPIIYTVTKASSMYRYATNVVLSYDEATQERELAVLMGIV
jgi:hypothetical protein